MFWLVIIALTLLFVYYKVNKPHQHWEKRNIPYIKPWPFVGNMAPLVFGKMSLFHLIKKFYDDTKSRYIGIYQFLQPILLVNDVELIKNITIKDFDHFIDHDSFFSASREPVFHENLFSSTGQQWRDLRSTLSPAFTGSKMRSMFILMQNCASRFTDHFVEAIKNNNNKVMEVELKDIYKRFTIDVIGTCAYGVESNSMLNDKNEFYEQGREISDFSGVKGLKTLGFLINAQIMRFFGVRFFSDDQINFFQNIITKSINYREKNNIYRPDLIHLMMEARKGKLKFEESVKNDDTGFATVSESDVGRKITNNLDITDNLIVAQAMIFFIGGTDTSSTLLCLASHEIAVNEDVQRKLQEEIDATMEECGGNLSYEALLKMKYLDMVISETLRLWSPGFFIDRLCVKDYPIKPTLPGEKPITIKKGEIVWIPIIGIQRDPQFYPNPDRFDPERFSDENKNNIEAGTYLPFGSGPRSCIGNRFALLVVKSVLFYILSKFDITCVEKTQVPLQLSKSQIIINASNGFWIGLKLRNKI